MRIERWSWRDWLWVGWCAVLSIAALLAIAPGWPVVGRWLSGDFAPAWVQAIGSVGAIIGAAWIARYQERIRADAAKAAAIKRVRNFAGIVQGTVEDVIERGSYWEVHMRMRRVVLEEAVVDARSTAVEMLKLDWIIAVQALRAIALNLCELMRDFEGGPDYANKKGLRFPANHAALLEEFARLKIEVDKHVSVIVQEHPGVAPYEE